MYRLNLKQSRPWKPFKPVLFLIIVMLFVGCASSEQRAMYKAMTQKAVAEGLAQRHLLINISSMTSARYGTRMVSGGFSLEIKGDTLVSYLPYIGQVYQGMVYPTPQGLNFEAPILAYNQGRQDRGLTRIVLETKTQEDLYRYVIDVYDTGKAYIRVRGQLRDPISFDGDVDVPLESHPVVTQ